MPDKTRLHCGAKDFTKHMCTLQTQGLKDCLQLLSEKPLVECRKCGAQADSAKNICAATVLPVITDVDGFSTSGKI